MSLKKRGMLLLLRLTAPILQFAVRGPIIWAINKQLFSHVGPTTAQVEDATFRINPFLYNRTAYKNSWL